jgi:hypothetical protein
MVCPHCKTPVTGSADYCIFCGTPFTRAGRRVTHYSASSPQKTPAVVKAQRFFYSAAVFVSLTVGFVILLSPQGVRKIPPLSVEAVPSATPQTPALSSAAPVPTPTPEATAIPSPSPAPLPTEAPQNSGSFFNRSGAYPVSMYISEVESANPDTQAAGEAILNETFDGTMTLAIDSLGDGTIQIEQGFFSPDAIFVSAFVDSANVTSQNTLYGVSNETGYVLTVVCVCADGGISGFIWMDNEETHIEFIYFG